jgi:hypothetical protein
MNTGGRFLAGNTESKITFKVALTSAAIFANGANATFVTVKVQDENGQDVDVKSKDLRLISDVPVEKSDFTVTDGVYKISVTPKVKSPKVRIMVAWKETYLSEVVELNTTLLPLKENLKPIHNTSAEDLSISGLTYTRGENFTEGQYEGFSIRNLGENNTIVDIKSAPHSERDFSFDFEEQATQNISMWVTDFPNGTTSETLFSYFMFFPRKNLPYAEILKDVAKVTLPTGEQVSFDKKQGTIVEGVFTEGPVDVGPDKRARHYADIKYEGKGILLRANARGQLPQQGQFEFTKIDMDYGLKGSLDVLIINGTTGQRCIRPKGDFWLKADVLPIQFKFPTDKEFNTYLLAYCGFGIPELADAPVEEEKPSKEVAQSIWDSCSKVTQASEAQKDYLIRLNSDYIQPTVETCLNGELAKLTKASRRGQIAFDIYTLYKDARDSENSDMPGLVDQEVARIKNKLISNVSWISDFSMSNIVGDCSDASPDMAQLKAKYHDPDVVLKAPLQKMCLGIKAQVVGVLNSDTSAVKKQIIDDLSWIKGFTAKEQFLQDCFNKGMSFINSSYRYQATPKAYAPTIGRICGEVEASDAYQAWMKQNISLLEDKIFAQLLLSIQASAEKKAQACLVTYPMNTPLNRIRFKSKREGCLMDSWTDLENQAIGDSQTDPAVQRSGLKYDNIHIRLNGEARRLQLQIMKQYFQ